MGRGKRLKESEVQVILTLNEGWSISKIAAKIKRSRKAVQNVLKDPENYGKKKSPGRPSALTPREKRLILREASNSTLTARQIATKAGVSTKIDNVRRVIRGSTMIQRKKIKRKPALTKRHKADRLKFAETRVAWKKKWRKILFSDEKKFNLDGPDGCAFYFHDLRKEEVILSRRQMGGGSVMVWAAIGYHGNTEIKFISGRLNSNGYIQLIDGQLQQYRRYFDEEGYLFQQDNAAIHTANSVRQYFAANNINVLQWPARSPDLNIIENVWGYLSRLVYQGGKQYQNIDELKTAIMASWQQIPQNYIKNLYKSLPNRMLEVIKNKGGVTHY